VGERPGFERDRGLRIFWQDTVRVARHDFWLNFHKVRWIEPSIAEFVESHRRVRDRCQQFPCANRETARKLYELCRGPDNQAPEFPEEPAAGNA
jgi:hypothetical protein